MSLLRKPVILIRVHVEVLRCLCSLSEISNTVYLRYEFANLGDTIYVFSILN